MRGKITLLGVWCSGASIKGLEFCSDVTWTKYSVLGFLNLLSSLLAFISISYFSSFVFVSKLIVFLLASIFCLMILNINRLMTSSVYQNEYIDSRDITLYALFKSIPRLIIGVIVSIMIVFPLEQKIFEIEVEKYIQVNEASQDTIKLNKGKISLLGRIIALDHLKETNPLISQVSTLLFFLVLLLEESPTIVLLLSLKNEARIIKRFDSSGVVNLATKNEIESKIQNNGHEAS